MYLEDGTKTRLFKEIVDGGSHFNYLYIELNRVNIINIFFLLCYALPLRNSMEACEGGYHGRIKVCIELLIKTKKS